MGSPASITGLVRSRLPPALELAQPPRISATSAIDLSSLWPYLPRRTIQRWCDRYDLAPAPPAPASAPSNARKALTASGHSLACCTASQPQSKNFDATLRFASRLVSLATAKAKPWDSLTLAKANPTAFATLTRALTDARKLANPTPWRSVSLAAFASSRGRDLSVPLCGTVSSASPHYF